MARGTGWIRDDDAVEAVTESLGFASSAAVNGEPLRGYASRQISAGNTGVFPHLAVLQFRDKFLQAYSQRRGVCVGCGTARAIEDSHCFSIAARGSFGRFAEVDVATIYAGSRTQRDLGNGRLDGDGSVGAWAAKWVHDHGAVESGKVAGYDLTDLNEKLAVEWGASGVPKAVLKAAQGIEINCFRCASARDIADCAFAGFGMAFCWDYTFSAKNSDGVSKLNVPASHCTELLGGAVTKGGNVLIGGQQSWGQNAPAGPKVLKYAGGQVALRNGMCFVPLGDFDKALRNGAECWAFHVVTGWR